MRLFRDEGAQGLAEYSLLLALIAAVIVITAMNLGSTINTVFVSSSDTITDALAVGP